MPEDRIEPLSDSHQVGRITITYDIDADGHMSSTYDSSEELPLVTQNMHALNE
jgi:hypothetical protein